MAGMAGRTVEFQPHVPIQAGAETQTHPRTVTCRTNEVAEITSQVVDQKIWRQTQKLAGSNEPRQAGSPGSALQVVFQAGRHLQGAGRTQTQNPGEFRQETVPSSTHLGNGRW